MENCLDKCINNDTGNVWVRFSKYTARIKLSYQVLLKSSLHELEPAAEAINLYVNVDKTEFMNFKQEGTISPRSGYPLKLVDHFTYLDTNMQSAKRDVSIRLEKAGTVIWQAVNHIEILFLW